MIKTQKFECGQEVDGGSQTAAQKEGPKEASPSSQGKTPMKGESWPTAADGILSVNISLIRLADALVLSSTHTSLLRLKEHRQVEVQSYTIRDICQAM